MKNIILVILLLCFITSCSKKKDTTTAEIDEIIVSNDSIIKDINFSEIVSEFKFIPLETTDESLIGSLDKIEFLNNDIYVLDSRKAKSVFRFSNSGKYLNKISAVGGGPGEYSLPDDIAISEKSNEIAILDRMKILIFKPDNKYVRTVKLPIYAYKFIWIDNHFALNNETENDLIIINAKNGEQTGAYFKNIEEKKRVLNYPFQLISDGNEALYFSNLEYTIYKITNNKVIPHLRFVFDQKMFQDAYSDQLKEDKSSINNFVRIKFYSENDTHIFMVYFYKKVPYMLIYNKKSARTKILDVRGIKNDLTYTPEPPIMMNVSNGYFISKFDFSSVTDEKRLIDKLGIESPNFNSMSNPIILCLKFK